MEKSQNQISQQELEGQKQMTSYWIGGCSDRVDAVAV